ncbi:MAG: hypothetical protein ABEK03_07810 [Candidatus Bipolaricaulia bacterium]
MRTLVCDIDNTIADARPRLACSLEAIGRPELARTAFTDYGGFKPFVTKDEHRRLFQVFLSERFMALDEPLPRAAEVLSAWTDRGHRLVYLTGRHDDTGDSMRIGTERWLQEHGFPLPDDDHVMLRMKPGRGAGDQDYKRQVLAELAAHDSLWAGIGDLPYEGRLYGEFGMRPILTAELNLIAVEHLQQSHPAAVIVHGWNEIAGHLASRLD